LLTFGSIFKNSFGQWLKGHEPAAVPRVSAGLWTDPKAWVDLIEKVGVIPLNIGILRPRIKFRMSAAIVLKKGAETCRNYEGFINALVADDAATMTKFANYTMRTKATVGRPNNIRVMRDVMFNGYCGGGNYKDMFGDDIVESALFQAAGAKNLMNLSLNVAGAPSAIYVALPMESTATSFSFVDLFGALTNNPLFRILNGKVDSSNYNETQAFPTAPIYSELYKLRALFPPNSNIDDEVSACDQSGLLGVTTMLQAWQCDHFTNGKHAMVNSSSHISNELSVPGSLKIFNGQGSNMRAKPIVNWDEVLLRCP